MRRSEPKEWTAPESLFNGKNLDGWEVRGDSRWTVLKDGTLVGVRPHANPFKEGPITRESMLNWFYYQRPYPPAK